MWGNTVAIHSVLEKTTKLNYLTAQYEKNLTKTILEKKQKNHKKRKKTMWGNTVVIHNVLKKKKL
jgi:type IV secretory pathway VirB3-like protein